MATSRGNPDGPTLDGKELERVHRKVMRKITSGEVIEAPLCSNGAWNLRWTKFDKQVTCPACLKKMGK